MNHPARARNRSGTALVTGGAGFIGTAISRGLADAFDRVVVVDSLHPQVHTSRDRPPGLDERVELVVGDVALAEVWSAVLDDLSVDVVVHLAAETGTAQSLAESTRHATANVVGTTQMLDAFSRRGQVPRRIVLTSSRAVYGEGAWRRGGSGDVFYPGQRSHAQLERGEWNFPGGEPVAMRASSVFPAPVSVYGATKLAQEQIVRSWASSFGVEATVLRLQNVYGPGQSLINPYTGIVSLFCRLARDGRSIPLYEDGMVRRDFVSIADVARAILAATLGPAPSGEAIDIGSGEPQTIAFVAELVARHYGAPAPHATGQFRDGDVRHAWADVSRANDVLGWRLQVSLDRGIADLARWIDSQESGPEDG